MAIRIVPHAEPHRAAVDAFNLRMRAGGSPWGFYPDPVPDWIPPRAGATVWREYYLALEDTGEVRGAFALKPQVWLVRGRECFVTDWQGPFSEGSVNPKLATLGLRLVREMLKLRPCIYSWGHGGNEQPVVVMLEKMGWGMHPTPLCLRIVHPVRFLRGNGHLRSTAGRRFVLDALAFTGLGWLGIHVLQAVRRWRHGGKSTATATEVPSFGPWADDLWQRHKDSYLAVACRDMASMNDLAPATGWPPVVRLKIDRGGVVVGWALVMDTRMKDDPRYGSLRVGSIVDCFAAPADAGDVVAAATRFLEARGVDLIASNQAHPGWVAGFRSQGYTILPGKRLFAPSPALRELLAPFDDTARGLHLTNMDGHGPMGF